MARFVERLIQVHGKPVGNPLRQRAGATSFMLTKWFKGRDIALRFIQPGKHNQNALIDRFNQTFYDVALIVFLFDAISEVQEVTDG